MRVIQAAAGVFRLKHRPELTRVQRKTEQKRHFLMYYRAIYMGHAFLTCFPEVEELRLKH